MSNAPKSGLHPRNRHRHGYDFKALIAVCPELAAHVRPGPTGRLTIDFANPVAVKALNRALLCKDYRLRFWDIPTGYLCPPIPGRVDYLHHLADLLADGGEIPQGAQIRLLDIGTGANCIYPLLGHQSYGWQFVGSDVDGGALNNARLIVKSNGLEKRIVCREQRDVAHIFSGIIQPGEYFAATLCNPPFHPSAAAANEGSERKLRNLARSKGGRHTSTQGKSPALNFGGRNHELWCEGGEAAFLRRMIAESRRFASQCGWFTSLVSKGENIRPARSWLASAGANEVRVITMAQGNKQTRILAWRFSEPDLATGQHGEKKV